jgi:nickel/cobalt transporter (NicO) family protein
MLKFRPSLFTALHRAFGHALPRGEGCRERIQFGLPASVRRWARGGSKPCWTNPLRSPFAKGDTCEVTPTPFFSQLHGLEVRGLQKGSTCAKVVVPSHICWILLVMVWFALGSVTLAHPMGNFSISHYSSLKVEVSGVELVYIIDMAEVPTFQDKAQLDLNSDGSISPDEKDRYLAKKAELLTQGLLLRMNGADLKLREVSRQVDLLPGGLNLPTTRLKLHFRADYHSASEEVNSLEFQDNNFPGRLGWKEIVAQAADGVQLLESSVPASDKTRELSVYPEDPTVSPPQDLTARLKIRIPIQLSGATPAQTRQQGLSMATATRSFQQGDSRTLTEQQRLTRLLSSSVVGVNVILLAMFVAFGLGAFHALSPGHGKTVVGAYLVGSRGTAKHAILLGGIVTITHTMGVFLLGLVTLYASKYILPEKLYPWLGFFSGLAVVVIGLSLFLQRYRNLHAGTPTSHDHRHEHGHDDHSHSHDAHHHDHSHEHVHAHAQLAEQAHAHEHGHMHEHGHTHDHSHDHAHSHATESLPHDPDDHHSHHHHPHEHPHSHSHDHGGAHTLLTHTHGGVTHSHDYSDVRFKDLFTLGVSGGIVPCPSALVVLLSAISLNRVGLGLLMIVAFSLGLALVLMAIGLLMVYARGFMERIGTRGRLWQTLPVFSPLIIAVLGVVIAVQALVGAGIVHIQISGVN